MPPRKQNLENLKREKEAFSLARKLIGKDKFVIPTKPQKISPRRKRLSPTR